MLNLFESLVHKNDLSSIPVNRKKAFNIAAIHFQKHMGILRAEQNLNISSVIFRLNAEVIKFSEFYYVKCLGNFPARCNANILEMIKDSLNNLDNAELPAERVAMKFNRFLPIDSV